MIGLFGHSRGPPVSSQVGHESWVTKKGAISELLFWAISRPKKGIWILMLKSERKVLETRPIPRLEDN